MFYSYLSVPRAYSPRWYHEGIAVFLETWMSGGLGRALGGYDEMVFRAMVRENAYIYDYVGLESEGTSIDFQVGVNSYMYGTRFFTYLGDKYGPEKLIEWVKRTDGTPPVFLLAISQGLRRAAREGMGRLDRIRARVAKRQPRSHSAISRHCRGTVVGAGARVGLQVLLRSGNRTKSTSRSAIRGNSLIWLL